MIRLDLDRRHVITGLIALGVAVAAWLWWYQGHISYQLVWVDKVEIAGDEFAVRRWEGVFSPDTPRALRACFVLQEEFQAVPELSPKPPEALGWFRCFNTEFIRESLASGEASAYVAARDDPPGYDRIIAVLPGGRMFMWRQPSAQ